MAYAPVRLLLTRPHHAAHDFIRDMPQAIVQHSDVHISPVLAIQITPFAGPPPAFKTLLFTSANGVKAAKRLGIGLGANAFCVGPQTNQAAQHAAYVPTHPPHPHQSTTQGLVDLCLQNRENGPFWHLRGAHTSGDICGQLQAAGVNAAQTIIYQQTHIPLDDTARAWMNDQQRAVIIPLFSPRSARLTFEHQPQIGNHIHLIAMSKAIADALPSDAWRARAVICPKPDRRAVQLCLQQMYHTLTKA